MVLVASFDKRLVDTTAAGYNANSCTAAVVEPFRLTAGHPDTNPVLDLVNNNCLYT
jgi:hypothetical protein